MKRRLFIFLPMVLLIISFQDIFGQFYTLGNDPANIKWQKITTENYVVIFPQKIDSLARQYVSSLENERLRVMEPLQISPKRIPIVLHPYYTRSNGMVVWAPKRVDLFTTPSAYGGTPEPWIQQLAIHESRHIGQVSHYTTGGYRALSYLMGEQITGVGLFLFTDNMFLEGDAVVAETELTTAGRGRNAEFMMYYRAAFLNGDFRNWARYKFGSYKYYTPNIYAFGYLYESGRRFQEGDYFLPHTLATTPFYKWKQNGKTKKDQFRDAQKLMTNIWEKDLKERGKATPFDTVLTTRNRLYTEYRTPVYIQKEKSLFTIKKGMEHTSAIVQIDSTGSERHIRPFNSYSSQLTSSPGRHLYWSESHSFDAVDLEDFSDIFTYDLITRKTSQLTRRARYFNPQCAPKGDRLAVVEYPIEGSSYLVILNAATGAVLQKTEAPHKGQLRQISFVGDDIYCTAILDKGVGIYKLTPEEEWKEVVPEHNISIDGLRSFDSSLYFHSDLDGVVNIYYYDTDTDILYRLTNSKYGASDPYLDSETQTLYYSEFSTEGYQPAKAHLNTLQWKISYFDQPYRHPVAEQLSLQAQKATQLSDKLRIDAFDTEKYPAEKYNKLFHLFRFHSWAPVYYNVDKIMAASFDSFYEVVSLGATAYSQNTLGTAVTMLGYSYRNGFHAGHAKFSLGSTLNAEASVDFNDRYSTITDIYPNARGYAKANTFSHTGHSSVRTRMRLYYNLFVSNTGWNRGLIPQLEWTYSNDRFYSPSEKKYTVKNVLSYGARYYQSLDIAPTAIFPRYGFGISAMGSKPLGKAELFGTTAYFYGYLYLPGLTRQQGLKLTGTYQRQFVTQKYFYLNSFTSLPRGYTIESPTQNYFKATIDYAVPIYLGDISLGRVLYLKRLQLIPFADFAHDVSPSGIERDFYSFGTDLLLDMNMFHFNQNISIGVRYAHTGPQLGTQNSFNLLFSFSL